MEKNLELVKKIQKQFTLKNYLVVILIILGADFLKTLFGKLLSGDTIYGVKLIYFIIDSFIEFFIIYLVATLIIKKKLKWDKSKIVFLILNILVISAVGIFTKTKLTPLYINELLKGFNGSLMNSFYEKSIVENFKFFIISTSGLIGYILNMGIIFSITCVSSGKKIGFFYGFSRLYHKIPTLGIILLFFIYDLFGEYHNFSRIILGIKDSLAYDVIDSTVISIIGIHTIIRIITIFIFMAFTLGILLFVLNILLEEESDK